MYEWLTENLVWIVFMVLFIGGVGILWPMSDSAIRVRPRKLFYAEKEDWEGRSFFPVSEIPFLWYGFQRPKKSVQVAAWLRASERFFRMRSLLERLAREGKDGSFVLRSSPVTPPLVEGQLPSTEFHFSTEDLALYAAHRARVHGEEIPEFLSRINFEYSPDAKPKPRRQPARSTPQKGPDQATA